MFLVDLGKIDLPEFLWFRQKGKTIPVLDLLLKNRYDDSLPLVCALLGTLCPSGAGRESVGDCYLSDFVLVVTAPVFPWNGC